MKLSTVYRQLNRQNIKPKFTDI